MATTRDIIDYGSSRRVYRQERKPERVAPFVRRALAGKLPASDLTRPVLRGF